MVTAQELQELLEVTIWNYHGTPHASLGGLTPLEMMSRHVLGIRRPAVRLRLLPAPMRQQPALLHDPVMCQVRGQAARGEKPHITYMHVRYTSLELARRVGSWGGPFAFTPIPRTCVRPRGGHRVRRDPGTTSSQRRLAGTPALPVAAPRFLQGQAAAAARFRCRAGSDRGVPCAAAQASQQEQAGNDGHRAGDRDRAKGRQALHAETSTSPPKSAEPQVSLEPAPTELQGLATGPVRGKTLRITRGFAR